MDREIDLIFHRIFTLASDDRNQKIADADKRKKHDRSMDEEMSKLLVMLEYMLPTYHRAVDLIEQHSVIVLKQRQKMKARENNEPRSEGRGTEMTGTSIKYGKWDERGVFTRYHGKWSHLTTGKDDSAPDHYKYWHVQPSKHLNKKNKERSSNRAFGDADGLEEGRDKPLETSDGFGLVNLERWECNCTEYISAKYCARPLDETAGLQGLSGWGQGYGLHHSKHATNTRVPTCIHLVSVFLFVNGQGLFEWARRRQTGEKSARTGTEAVDDYEETDFLSLNEFLGLAYQFRLGRDALEYESVTNM